MFFKNSEEVLDKFEEDVNKLVIIENAVEFIEKNKSLLKYADLTLYQHQKDIFTACKTPNPKLILYMAPTGTGKTMTPIALSEQKKIIFVCAARHVGLALARAAISMKKKIAEYTAPDLSEFDKRLAVIEQNSSKTADYTRDIKTDLKGDIRRNEQVTESVERFVKQANRETDQDLKSVRKDVLERLDRVRDDMDKLKRDTDSRVEKLNRDVDAKIQKAIDNPLANK